MNGIIAEAAARGQADLDLGSVDSTVSRAHHHAAGMVVDPELLEDLEKAVAEEKGLLERSKSVPIAPPGEGDDQPAREERRRTRRRCRAPLRAAELGRPRGGLTTNTHLAADRRSRPLSFVVTSGQAADSPKTDQAANRKKKGSRGGRPVGHDPDLYKDRNTVERCINKIKEWRGLATRYDKTPTSYLAGLHLRGAVIWLRSLRPVT